VPYPAGASTDLLARTLAPRLSASMGQPVLVDNRGGASGNIGAAYVASGPSDGTRILVATEPIIVVNPHLYANMGFDPTKDLVPLANGATTILGLAGIPRCRPTRSRNSSPGRRSRARCSSARRGPAHRTT
jgi:tripartite-type tricarboxylate transporter receptor subunit TctC